MDDALLLTFYGDDFTGSTDVMEVLATIGIRTALFLEPPSVDDLARFPKLGAIGVAGTSRTMSPEQMDATLPVVFSRLKVLGAPLFHYKICSTFDSAPRIGNIGRAIDLGQNLYRSPLVPLMVGAPALGRYCIFGHLFARSGLDSEPYRLDRHPTMRQHPVTPMGESDLRLHLAEQTTKTTSLFSVLDLGDAHAEARFARLAASGAEIVLFDVLYEEQLALIGRLIWSRASREAPLFAVGSSGLEYALAAYWRSSGRPPAPASVVPLATEQVIVVSGSCSPVTDRQIAWAVDRGWVALPLEPARLLDRSQAGDAIAAAVRDARAILADHRGVIVHTCRGPRDPRLACHATAERQGTVEKGRALGTALGRILHGVLAGGQTRRAAVTGGDTSGYVARELGVTALEMVAPLAPGAPLCRVYARDGWLNGCEIVFKGGQVGRDDFFSRVSGGVGAG